jgi:hypothetical protein
MVISSLVLLGLVLGLAPAEEAQNIKIKKAAKGDAVKTDDTEETNTALVATDGAGNKVLEQKEKISKTNVYTETILEKKEGDDKATSLKRVYEKARGVGKDGKEEIKSYEGKTVLIEKKGDKYVFSIEGGKEITGKDAEDLDKSFNKEKGLSDAEMEKYLLPAKAVKSGDTWKVDAKSLMKDLGKSDKDITIAFDDDKTEGYGKLLEAYSQSRRW